MVNLVIKPFATVKQIIINEKRIIIFGDEGTPFYFWTHDDQLSEEKKDKLKPYIAPLLALYGVHYEKCKRY